MVILEDTENNFRNFFQNILSAVAFQSFPFIYWFEKVKKTVIFPHSIWFSGLQSCLFIWRVEEMRDVKSFLCCTSAAPGLENFRTLCCCDNSASFSVRVARAF